MKKFILTQILVCFLFFAYGQAGIISNLGNDVSESAGGYGIFGTETTHIAIDEDDIQAKSDADNYGKLFLNDYGGDVEINGGVILTSYNTARVGVNLAPGQIPQSDFHISQVDLTAMGINLGNAGIRIEHDDTENYWNTYIDDEDDYVFRYNNILESYIDNVDGVYYNFSGLQSSTDDTRRLRNTLDHLMQLKPTIFESNTANKGKKGKEKHAYYGLIAQEVETVFPELIVEKEGRKGLAYDNFAILSVQAIQELKSEVDEKNEKIVALEEELSALQNRMNEIEKLLTPVENRQNQSIESTTLENGQNKAFLKQNSPNPYKGETQIAFYVPATTQNALIQIMDTNGKILKIHPIASTGNVSLKLNNQNWQAGMYVYTLIIDNQIVDSKQMIISH